MYNGFLLQNSLQKRGTFNGVLGIAMCVVYQRNTLSWSTQRVALAFTAR